MRGGHPRPAMPGDDPYLSDVHLWWHFSRPSPELVAALASGILGDSGTVVDLGCGLGSELAWLSSKGWSAIGLDLSMPALRQAATCEGPGQGPAFLRADVRQAPLASGRAALVIDRGCLHYLCHDDRQSYVKEVARILRPGGRLFLRCCLYAAGVRNDLDEAALLALFDGWSVLAMERQSIPSNSRSLEAIVTTLLPPPILS